MTNVSDCCGANMIKRSFKVPGATSSMGTLYRCVKCHKNCLPIEKKLLEKQ